MDDYDVLEIFNPANESVNFGTRCIAGQDNLYEAVTLCTLGRSHEESSGITPNIICIRHLDQIFLCLANGLRVFSNVQCSSVTCQYKLDSTIDALGISNNFIVICLRNGVICVHDVTKNSIVYQGTVTENTMYETNFVECIFENSVEGKELNFLLVTRKGVIYRITFDILSGEPAYRSNIIANLNNEIKQAAYINEKLILNGKKLVLCDTITGDLRYRDALDLKRLFSYSENQFIGLQSNGYILLICSETFTTLQIDEFFCDDLIFYNEGERKYLYYLHTNENKKFVSLTHYNEEFINIFSLPTKQPVVGLVKSEVAHDEQLFISSEDYRELYIQMVSETVPEKRLERLLKRGHFEDAEAFAEMFSLDQECIMKVKAEYMIEATCDECDIKALIAILDKIQDVSFKLECCLKVTSDSSDDLFKILNYGLNMDIKKENMDEDIISSMIRIKDANDKLYTLVFLLKYKKCHFNSQLWRNFLLSDLNECLLTELKQQNIETSILIFSRQNNLKDEDYILSILALLKNMPLECVMSFMYTFVPKTLALFPSTLPAFLNFVSDRIYYLEGTTSFPENAIDFTNRMTKLLSVDINSSIYQNTEMFQEASDNINELIKSLNIIQRFKNQVNVFIPLEDCSQGPVKLVKALLLLDSDIINDEFINFLAKFLLENQFNPDAIFAIVIENLLLYDEKYWIKIVSFIWSGINCTETKLNTLLVILRSAGTPWSPIIHSMIQVALKMKHPLVCRVESHVKKEALYTVLEKYNLKEEANEDYLAINRIVYCNEPTVIDDVFTLCMESDRRVHASLIMVQSFKDEFKTHDIISKLDINEINKLFDSVLSITRSKKRLTKCDINILETIFSKVMNSKMDYCITEINNLKTTLFVQSYSDKYSVTDIVEKPDIILDEILDLIVAEINDENKTSHYFDVCQKVANAFYRDLCEILVLLSEKITSAKLTCDISTYVYEESTDQSLLCKMALNTFIHIGVDYSDLKNSSDSFDISENTIIDTEYSSLSILLMLKLITKATLQKYNPEVDKIHNWIMLCRKTSESFSLTTMTAIKKVYTAFTTYQSGSDFSDLNRVISMSVQSLCDEGNYMRAIDMIFCMKNESIIIQDKLSELLEFLPKILSQCIKNAVGKIFTASEINKPIAMSLMHFYSYDQRMKLLQKVKGQNLRNLEKLKTVAEIGITLSNTADQTNFRDMLLLIKWIESIDKSMVTPIEFFTLPKNELLEKLIMHHFNLEQLTQFCIDFQLNPQKFYFIYLEKLLVHWKPPYEGSLDLTKNTQLMAKEEEKLYNECKQVINLLVNQAEAIDYINNLWIKVNVYHYEVFCCKLRILESFNQTEQATEKNFVLQFLKTYTRTSKPHSIEIEEWLTKFPDSAHIDPLSQWRLPFTTTLFTSDLWNILKNEVNLNNYSEWFTLVTLLNTLKVDDICTYVVKGCVLKCMFKKKENEVWMVRAYYTSLLDQINTCIKHIEDISRATSVAYYLTKNIPGGADQVYSAKMCYELAKCYRESGGVEENINKAFAKIRSIYYSLSAKHILYLHNLGDEKYLDLTSQPNELIENLYNDPRIIQKTTTMSCDCPDFDKAAHELAELFHMNITDKKIHLLEGWLSNGSCVMDNPDETILMKPAADLSLNDSALSLIQKAAYLCTSDEIKFWRNYLFEKAMEETNTPYSYKARALKCLCLITPNCELKRMTESDNKAISYHIDKLFLLHDLQNLGINITFETLNMKQMKMLLKKLVKNPENVLNLKVIVTISILYDVYDVKLWEIIIKTTMKLELYDKLKVYVAYLQNKSVYNERFYIDAWQCIIDKSFESLDNSDDKEGIYQVCIKCIHQLQICPVLYKINVKAAFNICLRLSMPHMAALLIQYVPSEKQSTFINYLLKIHNKEKLMASAKDLHKEGLLGVDYVIDVLGSSDN